MLSDLTCQTCGGALEHQMTIDVLEPPLGKIDTAYCPRCARLVERVRETGTIYESTGWAPLCRACRQPVTCTGLAAGDADEGLLYRCVMHPAERWTWRPRDERWARVEGLHS